MAKVRDLVLPALDRQAPVEAWIVDDTGIAKKGGHSVGVARQYRGRLGKQDNCQIAAARAAGITPGVVLADAAYGRNGAFRAGVFALDGGEGVPRRFPVRQIARSCPARIGRSIRERAAPEPPPNMVSRKMEMRERDGVITLRDQWARSPGPTRPFAPRTVVLQRALTKTTDLFRPPKIAAMPWIGR